MWILLIITIIVVYIFIAKSAKTNSTDIKLSHFKGLAKAHEQLDNASLSDMKIMLAAKQLLIDILINNIRCLPKSVLYMEYTQKAINAFVFYYGSTVFNKKLSSLDQVFAVMSLTFEDLHKKGLIDMKSIDFHINEDPSFKMMPIMISAMSHLSAEQQTVLLVFIENYMGQKLGHKVRYIGQRPDDNPLNE